MSTGVRRTAESTRARLALALLLMAALSVGGSPSQANEDGCGLFMKTNSWGYTVINLTNYALKKTAYDVEEHDGCCSGPCGATPFDLPSGPVSAMRTFAEHVDGNCSTDSLTWTGTVTFGFDGSYLADSSFQVVMLRQTAADSTGDLHGGTWISLSSAPGSQGWVASQTKTCGIYTNAEDYINNYKERNVMTLFGPKIQIVLYSMDNRNVVLVVRQINENANGWNDCGNYQGYRVNFSDNGSGSVPQ